MAASHDEPGARHQVRREQRQVRQGPFPHGHGRLQRCGRVPVPRAHARGALLHAAPQLHLGLAAPLQQTVCWRHGLLHAEIRRDLHEQPLGPVRWESLDQGRKHGARHRWWRGLCLRRLRGGTRSAGHLPGLRPPRDAEELRRVRSVDGRLGRSPGYREDVRPWSAKHYLVGRLVESWVHSLGVHGRGAHRALQVGGRSAQLHGQPEPKALDVHDVAWRHGGLRPGAEVWRLLRVERAHRPGAASRGCADGHPPRPPSRTRCPSPRDRPGIMLRVRLRWLLHAAGCPEGLSQRLALGHAEDQAAAVRAPGRHPRGHSRRQHDGALVQEHRVARRRLEEGQVAVGRRYADP
mmetsp:Transcript_29993/g.86289  ORF Transcript_29993/g.86289 Transcript_29993/m.86289 type:complete len:350 (+) Transcript_29993:1265-2314(+)